LWPSTAGQVYAAAPGLASDSTARIVGAPVGVVGAPGGRFVLRCLLKNPSSAPCMVLVGNHCAMHGSTKLAIAEYLRAHAGALMWFILYIYMLYALYI
jgi:hypothetical protein